MNRYLNAKIKVTQELGQDIINDPCSIVQIKISCKCLLSLKYYPNWKTAALINWKITSLNQQVAMFFHFLNSPCL